jgi:hypothetical protein
MIRRLLRALLPAEPPIYECERPGCYSEPHYHWGYGQRRSSLERPRGPNTFGGQRIRFAKGGYPPAPRTEYTP